MNTKLIAIIFIYVEHFGCIVPSIALKYYSINVTFGLGVFYSKLVEIVYFDMEISQRILDILGSPILIYDGEVSAYTA